MPNFPVTESMDDTNPTAMFRGGARESQRVGASPGPRLGSSEWRERRTVRWLWGVDPALRAGGNELNRYVVATTMDSFRILCTSPPPGSTNAIPCVYTTGLQAGSELS